jgi:ferredoxin
MAKSSRTFYALMQALKFKKPLARLSRVPGIKAISRRYLGPDNASITYIPVNEQLEIPPGTVAPVSIVEHFIDTADYHVVSYHCMCRKTMGCSDYDPDFGCIFMGDAAREIHPSIARPVSREEAKEHVRKAAELGLVTSIGKFRLDAFALGLKDYDRLMSVCHCCPCCCLYEIVPHADIEFQNMVVPLEGVAVEVNDACDGCGACVAACLFKQMEVVGGKAVQGTLCKSCGRCELVCTRGAVTVRIDDPTYFDACVQRLSSKVEL